MFNLYLRSNLYLATARLSVNTIYHASLGIIRNLITMLNVRAGQSVLENLNQYHIDTMIVHSSTECPL